MMPEIDPKGALGSLLSNKLLSVPYYQRAYSWKESHVLELYEDLRRAIDRGSGEYFLGSIIACAVADGKLEIVDGQQRLATTAILFAAMRDYTDAIGDQRATDLITSKFLYRARSITEGDDVFNLKLSEADDSFFADHILSAPSQRDTISSGSRSRLRDSNKKILAASKVAIRFVKSITSGMEPTDASTTIQKWIDFIEFKARVILVTVEDHEEAHVIFETMNDRGLDLSIADLTKNHLFLQSGDKIEEAKARWQRMVGAFEAVTNKDITKFYIHHLYSSQYGVAKSRDVFGQIRAKTGTRANALEFLKYLGDNSHVYAALRNSDHEFWNQFGSDARQHIRVLSSSLRVTQIRVLLLAVLAKFSEAEVKRFLPSAVCWSVRFLIAGGPTGNLETNYSQNAVLISRGDITTAAALKSSMRSAIPTDDAFRASFSSATVKTGYLARYYLQCLERAATGQLSPHLAEDNEILGSLEHVLPKVPNRGEWPNVSDDDIASYVNRIGNLALLDSQMNSTRGNGSFEAAKLDYEKCEMFQLTKQLSDLPAWGIEQIETRQQTLADYAVDAWPL